MEVQVHGQERDVLGDVRATEPLVELDAVYDADAVPRAVLRWRFKKYLGGVQVAVAIPDPSLLGARLENRPVNCHECPAVGRQVVMDIPGQCLAHKLPGLGEVLLNVLAHRSQVAESVYPGSGLSLAVEPGYSYGDALGVLNRDPTLP